MGLQKMMVIFWDKAEGRAWELVIKGLGSTTATVRNRRGAWAPAALTWVYTSSIFTSLKTGAGIQTVRNRGLDSFTLLAADNFPLQWEFDFIHQIGL